MWLASCLGHLLPSTPNPKLQTLKQEGCGSLPGAGTFYGSYESGPSVLVGNAWVCFDDGPGQSDGTNNIYGCGKSSSSFEISREAPNLACGVFTRALGDKNVGPWTGLKGSNTKNEGASVLKGSGGGGLLCCKKPCEPLHPAPWTLNPGP